MDEQDLQILLSLAETGNLTKTAAKLYLAQPTLTKRLQNIEHNLGVQLFIRSKSGITLTPIGEKAIGTAKEIEESLGNLRRFIMENRDYVGGTLKVASSLDYSRYCLPDVLERYARAYPAVNLEVSTAHSVQNLQTLIAGRCHVAIVRGDFSWDGESRLLSSEAICLIRCQADAQKPLSSLRYISRYSDSNHMSLQMQWLIEHHLSPESTLNVDALATCVSLAERGLGWSIVPEICLGGFTGIIEPLYFEDGTPLRRNTYLLWNAKEGNLPQVQAFVDLTESYAKEMRQEGEA